MHDTDLRFQARNERVDTYQIADAMASGGETILKIGGSANNYIEIGSGATWSFQFEDLAIPTDASIVSVIEHYEDSGFTGPLTFEVNTGPPNAQNPPPLLSTNVAPRPQANEGIDFFETASVIDTPAEVNAMNLVIRRGSGSGDANIDAIQAEVFFTTGTPPPPDYTLSVVPPSSVTVTAGSPANYTVNIVRTGGHIAGVTFTISPALPTGVNATFNPNPSSTSNSALQLTKTGSTPAGTYNLTVTGTDGALTRTAAVTLVVQAPPTPDYTLSVVPPSSVTVTAGSPANYTVNIVRTGGHIAGVTFTISPDVPEFKKSSVWNAIFRSGTSGTSPSVHATEPRSDWVAASRSSSRHRQATAIRAICAWRSVTKTQGPSNAPIRIAHTSEDPVDEALRESFPASPPGLDGLTARSRHCRH